MNEEKHFESKIYSKKMINHISNKIKLLGPNFKYDAIDILNFQFISAIILFIFIMYFSHNGYITAPLITIIYLFLFEKIFLDYKIKLREKKLESEAIFFFEILNLTLESGRNLKNALEIAAANVDSELSLEFKKMLNEVKMGKSFSEALKSMRERIPSAIVNSVILNLVEANNYGTNVTNTLNNELDYLREKKLLNVKAEIVKLPTKISVISVLFFIPIMLLIILAPVLIDFIS
jgi:tight adherence protein C